MSSPSRRRFLAAAGLTALAGCTGLTGSSGDPADGGGTATPTDGSGAGTPNESPLIPAAADRLPLPMEPAALRDHARGGGPPKDGIPSIDQPSFVAAGGANFLDDGDPVFGLVRDGVVKAYPQKVLVWHEIVNDDLDGTPVSVTYCPLTGTVLGFERGRTTFGVSGMLINNNLVMYDRATEAWWPQVLATAIPGAWNEDPEVRSLREFRLVWTTWKRWRECYPKTQVLSTNTGYAKNYGRDPYGSYNPRGGYYEDGDPLFPSLSDDDRYDPKTVVMGARAPEGAVAVPKAALRKQRLVAGELGDTPVVAVYDPGLDTGYVYRNPEEAAFDHEGDVVVDDDGTGHAPDELPLDHVHTFDAMWFAWSGFYPDTNVHA